MEYYLPLAPLQGPLPIPHLFQWPDYTQKGEYHAIIPADFVIQKHDIFHNGLVGEKKISSILERRPAKGDWSKHSVHKNPDFIKFLAY